MKKLPKAALYVLLIGLSSATLSAQQTDAFAPEISTQTSAQTSPVSASKMMVSVANPLAAKVGLETLQNGGHAMDAMVAIQAMLGLVEPQSSGLGGGAFLVYFDAETNQLTTFDARETAPQSITTKLFQNEAGEPLKFFDAVVGGRSVGTPGTPKLMYDMHQRYGKLSWNSLLQPSIKLATKGFEVSPRLSESITADSDRLQRYPDTANYFFNADKTPLQTGQTLTNFAYAQTLKTLANDGIAPFYEGAIGDAIVDKVASIEDNPGYLQMIDLQSYQVKERPPVCVAYRNYEVCGMGPPSSGALTVGQILGILNQYNLSSLDPNSGEAWHLIGEASRLAFADRGRYMADSDYVPMPQGLLDTNYLQQRASLIDLNQALENISAGEPNWNNTEALSYADDISIELPSTSHFSIRDEAGNWVSMTTTIENGFGSRVMSGGFLLNNELTDFSFKDQINGLPIANRIEPGKRPRSSMSPTIILKDGKPYMAIGSPGGSRIIGYVVKTIVAHVDWGMNIQQAINFPNRVNRFGTFDLEAGADNSTLKTDLEKRGFKVNIRDLNSGIHAIQITDSGLVGAADPRREGVALGK